MVDMGGKTSVWKRESEMASVLPSNLLSAKIGIVSDLVVQAVLGQAYLEFGVLRLRPGRVGAPGVGSRDLEKSAPLNAGALCPQTETWG